MDKKPKVFFDVITDLRVEEKLRKIFERVYVEEVAYSKNTGSLVFQLKSAKLIHYQFIQSMTEAIKTKIFPNTDVSILLQPVFECFGDMALEEICVQYKSSILYELLQKKPTIYLALQNASWQIEGNCIHIVLENTHLAQTRSKELYAFMNQIFQERFSRDIKVNIDFSHQIQRDTQFIEENEKRLMEAIETVMANTSYTTQESEGELIKEDKEVKEDKLKNDKNTTKYRRPPKDPTVFYGKECEGEVIPIEEITDEIGEVVIEGKVIFMETREIRMEKTIIIFDITNFKDTITVKVFVKNEDLPDVLGELKKGNFYRVKGLAVFDKFDKEISIGGIQGIKPIADFTTQRVDSSEEKRVELHLHTMMSDMDSVVDIGKMIARAKSWGMPAVAITDHGCLQAFPIANHCVKKDEPFKVIYGVEAYFVDDLKEIATNIQGQSLNEQFIIFDIETTGFSPIYNKIIEIGAVKIVDGQVIDRFSEFVNPQVAIPKEIIELTGINDQMVKGALTIEEVLPKFLAFCQDSVMVAHNADFDMSFIRENAKRQAVEINFAVVDTVGIARVLLPHLGNAKLNNVAKHLGIKLENHHRAVDDANATADIFIRFVQMLEERDIVDLEGLNALGKASSDYIKKMPSYHGIILVKNEIGRVNLNRLVSISHLDYFNRRPRMPKSLIQKYREGLIIGSACEAGELFQAIIKEKEEHEIEKIVDFYDYLEIQPTLNNAFMMRSDKYKVDTEEDLRQYTRQIVELGERYNKPVVATCDVHFLDPEDSIYRTIIMAGKGFKDADDQPPLYFRTTAEMLEEFAFLGEQKAREVVITNTHLINNQIEKISPVLPNKCPPEIPNSDEELRRICYDKAHEIYGETLHPVVVERLERELKSIISNGFAVMYIIAQKLVWDSNDNGYLVGSRGSVGSSFAATMSGITEVNPLEPHYICPSCHFVDFESDVVKSYRGSSGCDMPDADCPKCGHSLDKEGHDIPFETFLGFKGNKEPDIDLNFSGEYQAKSHKYVEEIFGEGKAFRAGTIGTMAEKTALAYVYKYFQEKHMIKRRAEMRRLASGCTGVKRTTGQHPGGIIVVPHDREIYEFTPIQHPANDVNTPIITTHYEYHSIDHNLLKLDILGHDDPTIIRRLEDITGINSQTIKLDDPSVMALFHSTEILGITPKDIGGIQLGSLGVPEFGTDFVIQMLIDAKPKSFSDLVRISGLSHGTDVWLGNAQTLIEEGKGTISTVICTRDDIMTYLINQGVDKELSFTIMESVRKGKGLKSEWEEEMLKHNVPEWYIWSCNKIKYMFPKAHAAAYVMMAWRIAWYKVFYPVAYYTAFFSIRASAFSYELMCQGKEHLEQEMKLLTSKGKENLSAKELDTIKDMRLVQEMYARGFKFLPIDLAIAHNERFQIIDNQIMPALSAIDGLGEKAAEAIVGAVKDGPFLSKEDFRNRCKVSKTVTDKMSELGILGDLTESNQLDFFGL